MTNPATSFWRRVKKLRAIIKSLKAGTSVSSACGAAKVDGSTFWRWRKQKPALDELIYAIVDSRVQMVEDAHFKSAIEGNVTAQMNFLYNRSPDRWKDRRAIINNEFNAYNAASPLAKAKDSELEDIINYRTALPKSDDIGI